MSRELSQTLINSLDDDVIYPFWAVELLFDEDDVLRLWTGYGTLVYQGVSWVGSGTLLGISSIQETTEISAKGADVSLTGIPSEVISLALTKNYQGRRCNIYFGNFAKGLILKEDGSFILLEDGSKIALEDQSTSLNQLFSGYMDQMNIEDGSETCSISLAVENKLIDLERQRVARYTSGYQKSIYPDDLGLDFVEDIQDKEIFWGRNK